MSPTEPVSLVRLRGAVDTARECGFSAVCANDHLVFQTPWLEAGMLMPLALGAAAIAMTVFGLRGAREQATLALVGGLASAMAILAVHVAPRELQRYQPIRAFGERVAAMADADTKVGLAGRLGGPGLIFYSRHDIAWLDSVDHHLRSRAGHLATVSASRATDGRNRGTRERVGRTDPFDG